MHNCCFDVFLYITLLLFHFLSDVDVDKPDEKSIMTYVSQFFKSFPETGSHKKVFVFSIVSHLHTMVSLEE